MDFKTNAFLCALGIGSKKQNIAMIYEYKFIE